jgi:hypothetical protein
VIVVVGSVALRPEAPAGGRVAGLAGEVAGLAGEVATAAAAAGASVELVARIGEDAAGEELLLALARAGVGHLAVLRDPARPTAIVPAAAEPSLGEPGSAQEALLAELHEAQRPSPGGLPAGAPGPTLEGADISLGMRYLRDYRVVVAVEPLAEGGAAIIADAASFADAHLVVIEVPGAAASEAYRRATILEAPADDPEGAFAALVGRFAAALDRGEPGATALRAAVAAGGWEAAGD